MVAISLGITLVYCVFEIYRGITLGQRFIHQLILSYTIAETLIHLINHEVQAAGRMGCEKMTEKQRLYNNNTQQYETINPFTLKQHELHVMRTEVGYALLSNVSNKQQYVEINSSMLLHLDDFVVISDCIHTELARISAIQHQANNGQRLYFARPLHYLFDKNTMVTKVVMIDITIDKRKKNGTLYLSINGQRTPIAEFIDNLVFIRRANNAIQFQFDLKLGNIQKTWYGYAKIQA